MPAPRRHLQYPELIFDSEKERYATIVLSDGRETYVIDGKQAGLRLIFLLYQFGLIGKTDERNFSRRIRDALAMDEDGGLLAQLIAEHSFEEGMDVLFRYPPERSSEAADYAKVPHNRWRLATTTLQ